jgi:hypothetical protein
MTEIIANLGLTIQEKNLKTGDTFVKADISIRVDDTKPVEEQLEWARLTAQKAWEVGSDILSDKVTEEELANSKEKREIVIKALKNHNGRLKALELKLNNRTDNIV